MNKQPIRDFMQRHYSDERLAMLLVHSRDGKLTFLSCCCFVGIPTATHQLQGQCWPIDIDFTHTNIARQFVGAAEAEYAYSHLGWVEDDKCAADTRRRRILIPMIRAEMKRREKLRAEQETQGAGTRADCVLAGDAS